MYHGPIIDAHLHYWQPDINPHPWLAKEAQIPFRYGDYSALKKPYLPDDYQANGGRKHRVVASVYVDAEWDPADPLGETRYIHQIAGRYRHPNAVVAQAWLDHGSCEEVLSRQAQWSLVRSVRHKPGGAATLQAALNGERTLMSNPRWRAGFALLEKYGLHFDLQTPWWNFAEAAQLAADFPSTLMIINHTGLPADRSPEGLSAWHRAMELLARQPNVMIKISGLGEREIRWHAERQRWIVQETLAIFGVARCMFASNFPVDSLCGTLDTVWSGFKTLTQNLTPQQQQALFYDNAKRVYRIAQPQELDE